MVNPTDILSGNTEEEDVTLLSTATGDRAGCSPSRADAKVGLMESPSRFSRNRGKKLLLKWQWNTCTKYAIHVYTIHQIQQQDNYMWRKWERHKKQRYRERQREKKADTLVNMKKTDRQIETEREKQTDCECEEKREVQWHISSEFIVRNTHTEAQIHKHKLTQT